MSPRSTHHFQETVAWSTSLRSVDSGDSDLIDSFYSDDATSSLGSEREVGRDEYPDLLNSVQTAGYRFVSTDTAVLDEPFGVMVDVSQFLTATHSEQRLALAVLRPKAFCSVVNTV